MFDVEVFGGHVPHWIYSRAVEAVEQFDLCHANLRLADYWLSLWRGRNAPVRGDFNPKALAGVLPGLTLMELHNTGDVTCRLAGTAVDAALGYSLTGKSLMAPLAESQRPLRQHRWKNVAIGSIAIALTHYRDESGDPQTIQNLHLPFAGTTETGSRLFLVHTNIRPRLGGKMFRSPKWDVGLPDVYQDMRLA